MIRPTTSSAPPGGKGATTRTGLAGYWASAAAPSSAPRMPSRVRTLRMPPPVTRCQGGVSPAFKIAGAAAARIRLPGVAGESAREGKPGLQLCRDRADEAHPGDVDQLAHLLEADLRLAARDDRGHRLPGGRPTHLSTLARNLVCDAELRKQRGRQIGAAAAVRVRDRLRRKQRAPECLDAADVRLRGPGAHHHADLRAGEIDLAGGAHQASPAELVGGSPIEDHDICGLAPREARGNRLRRVAHRRAARGDQAVAARALENRAQLGIDAVKTGRDHHVHIGGGGCTGNDQGGQAKPGYPSRERSWLHSPSVPFEGPWPEQYQSGERKGERHCGGSSSGWGAWSIWDSC